MTATDTQPGKYVAANGLNIHYKEYGSGEPLILLHGGSADLESWQGQISTFEPHFRVIALDSRGHGKTDNPTGQLSYRLMADDVAAFIQALNLNKPLIFGYSDGGQIAMEFGIHYPTLSRALGLGGTQYKFAERYQDALKSFGMYAPGEMNFEEMDPEWVQYLKTAHPRDDNPDYWKTLMKQLSLLWWTKVDYTPADFQKISAPTLIIMGDRDGISIEEADEMYKQIPNGELAIIPNADHGSALNPRFFAIVLDFLLRHNTL